MRRSITRTATYTVSSMLCNVKSTWKLTNFLFYVSLKTLYEVYTYNVLLTPICLFCVVCIILNHVLLGKVLRTDKYTTTVKKTFTIFYGLLAYIGRVCFLLVSYFLYFKCIVLRMFF